MTTVIKLISFLLLYCSGVGLILAYVPSLSVAAGARMSGRLWFYDIAGFLWGLYIGSCLVHMLLGGRPFAYGRWEMSRCRWPKTAIWNVILLVIATAVGVFFANVAVRYGIRNP